jgi:hypothetical protein
MKGDPNITHTVLKKSRRSFFHFLLIDHHLPQNMSTEITEGTTPLQEMSAEITVITTPPEDGDCSAALKEEIKIHKVLYRRQVTRELRGIVMKEKILPTAFRVWVKPGQPRMSTEESKKCQKVLKFYLI